MSFLTNPPRFWFISKDRLALVETVTTSNNANASGGSITVDGASTSYETIETAKSVRIFGIGKASHFPSGTQATESDYDSSTVGPIDEIPQQFHEALVYKVISMGYEEPRNLNIDLASYFRDKYNTIVKEGKKFSRSGYITDGRIAPQDFLMATAIWKKDGSTSPSIYGGYTFGVVSGKTQLDGSFPDEKYTAVHWDVDLSGISELQAKIKVEFDDLTPFGKD